jgi:plasmid stability protein
MANLTLAIDDDILKKARIRALENGTSVNALVRDYLESYSGLRSEREQAIARFLELSRTAHGSSDGRRWTRDELYQDHPAAMIPLSPAPLHR